MKNLNWKLNANTSSDELEGIYTASEGEGPSAMSYIKAVNRQGEIVAQESWSVMGNHYRQGEKRFGDALEKAGYSRRAY